MGRRQPGNSDRGRGRLISDASATESGTETGKEPGREPGAEAGTERPEATGATAGVAPKGSPARPTREVPKTLAVWIATAGGLGFGPWAPGTWGALGTVVLFAPVFAGLGGLGYGVLVVAVTVVGVWASTAAERDFARHDDGRIVIDEVAGQLITLWPLVPLHGRSLGFFDLSFGLSGSGAFEVSLFSLLVVTGFVAFRWFDIRKPGAVRWAERRFEAGAGVMADDVVAGIYGAIVLIVPTYLVWVTAGAATAGAQG